MRARSRVFQKPTTSELTLAGRTECNKGMRFIVLAFLVLASTARADEDWAGWRGPRRDGTSLETGFPVKWSATENVLWKVPIPG